jgi:hypothetical protein
MHCVILRLEKGEKVRRDGGGVRENAVGTNRRRDGWGCADAGGKPAAA